MKKILATLTFISFLFSLVFAQGGLIKTGYTVKVGYIGLGTSSQEGIFTIHNTGDKDVSDISIYVDGKLYKTITALIAPKQGIETIINFEPGQHTVEVRTPEGAIDSVTVNILPKTEVEKAVTPQTLLTQYQQNLILIVILILIVVVGWTLIKKPKI